MSEKLAFEAEIKRQEESLRQAKRMSAVGSLLANVAHELNNPLSAPITQTALLAETTQDERTVKRANRIKKSAERCANIVKRFLFGMRKTLPQMQRVDLNDLVRESVELLRHAYETSGIDVRCEPAPDLPKTISDGEQLGQVLVNLINNAQQATIANARKGRHRPAIETGLDERDG